MNKAGFLPIFAALLLATPGMAQETPTLPSPEQQVLLGVDRFFAALKSSDRTRLAREMIPEGTIFVHNRMNPPVATKRKPRSFKDESGGPQHLLQEQLC